MLENLFTKSGFRNVESLVVPLEFVFDSGDHFVQNFVDMAAPMKKLLSQLSENEFEQFRKDLANSAISEFDSGSILSVPASAKMVTGTK
jgi:secreted Zn-dependent insulinase-like peptidase